MFPLLRLSSLYMRIKPLDFSCFPLRAITYSFSLSLPPNSLMESEKQIYVLFHITFELLESQSLFQALFCQLKRIKWFSEAAKWQTLIFIH